MRIQELRLEAFGPFTGAVLDLSRGQEGLHLVFGPNEAGKSSALRALRSLFYGIPERSTDDFLHPYGRMRIRARLCSSRGQVLEVIRRKGRANTLRGVDDASVVEESELRNLLQGVDESLFSVMFGIGYEDLVRGGQEILQGGGDVGQLVFAAGSGIVNLREVQSDLEAAADLLFKPSGQKPRINDTLARLKANRKALKEAQLSESHWMTHQEGMEKALEGRASLEAELLQRQKGLNRLERIQEALPLVVQRRELLAELQKYADAVLLPESFPEHRREGLSRLAAEENRKAQSLRNIEAYQKDMAGLYPLSGLLDNGDVIETLHRELGSQIKAAKDRVGLETLQEGLLAEAREILRTLRKDLPLEQAGTLRIQKNQAMQIQRLGGLYERIMTRMEESKDRIPDISRRIDRMERDLTDLPAPRSTRELQVVLADAEEAAPLERHLREEQAEIASALKNMALEQKRLGLENGPLDELAGLPIPSLKTIQSFDMRLDNLDRQLGETTKEDRKVRGSLRDVERRLEAQRLEQEVPDEWDLVAARERRDWGWGLIAWKLRGRPHPEEAEQRYIEEASGAVDLAGAFEAHLQGADAIVDRLRREADRVAARAALLADQKALGVQLNQLEEDRIRGEKARSEVLEAWGRLWQQTGIEPLSPREMEPWTRDFSGLKERVLDAGSRQRKVQAWNQEVEKHRARLIQGLAGSDEETEKDPADSLSVLMKRAQRTIHDQEVLQQTRKELVREKTRLEGELSEARSRLKVTQEELGQWQKEWEMAVQPIGLGPQALPGEANAVMEDLQNLFAKLREAGILQKRMEGIDRDAGVFEGKVKGLIGAIAPDLAGRSAQESVMDLHQRLKQTREAKTRKETLLGHLRQEEERIKQADEALFEIRNRLQGMCREAACEALEDLPEVERRSLRRRELEGRLKDTEDQLRRLSAGATVDAFVEEAMTEDPDGLAGKMDRLREEMERGHHERSRLDQTIGSEKTELSKMDGSSRAAQLAEEIQLLLGGLENDVERYARFKVASRVLSMAIERYRDQSQGPMLRRASDLFQEITAGSFEGIRAEYDQRGQPVIVGVRPLNQGIVPVSGMSNGTADQLYLALRLAGLEAYLEKNEPLPFIVDDILVMFDDDRAAAALRALALLSRKTQVLFFTHHRHLLDLAEKTLDARVLIPHFL